MQVSDVGTIKEPGEGATPRLERLDEAAKQIVGSVFYGTMLKTMRESGMRGKFGHGGRGEEVFAAQLDGVIAERAGKASRGGLAEFLYQRLERQQRLINDNRENSPLKVNR